MTPGKYPLQIYRGDTCRWQIRVWADDARTQPFDLTGLQARAEIRDKPAGSKIYPLTCSITLPNLINLELTPVLSRALPSRGVWDLRVLNPQNNAVGTILADTVAVTADVTGSTLTLAQRRHG